MRRIVIALAASAIATTMFAASAAASGPAPRGKNTIEIECTGIGAITVSTPKPEKSKGAAQIVGQKGHGRPVSLTFTLTDLRTGTVLVSETESFGGEKAHAKRETTQCSGVFAEAPASVFFEGAPELPPGVEPTDIIKASFEGPVVIKH
jgi:hypothetical protein